jgi:hypothetical protein
MSVLDEYIIDESEVDWSEDFVGEKLYKYSEPEMRAHGWQIENNIIQSGADPYDLEGVYILQNGYGIEVDKENNVTFYYIPTDKLETVLVKTNI